VSFASTRQKETYSFTLQQAIDYAIQNNYSAINANRDIEICKTKKMGNNNNRIASNNGSLGYQNNFELQKSLFQQNFLVVCLAILPKLHLVLSTI
jgi:outer membrane protein